MEFPAIISFKDLQHCELSILNPYQLKETDFTGISYPKIQLIDLIYLFTILRGLFIQVRLIGPLVNTDKDNILVLINKEFGIILTYNRI